MNKDNATTVTSTENGWQVETIENNSSISDEIKVDNAVQ